VIVGFGDFQRGMTPQIGTHLVKFSVHLPKSLNPQKITCLEWDEVAMALWGFGSVIIISYKNLTFTILKDRMLVSKMYWQMT
jgi:hypothetical protein